MPQEVLPGSLDVLTGSFDPVSTDNALPTFEESVRVLLGNAPGILGLAVEGFNDSVGVTEVDIAPGGGTQVLPSGVESWEVVSTDSSDTTDVTIETLGAEFAEQSNTTVTLDGLTAAQLTGTHFRARIASMDTVTNTGDIIFRVSGGGAERLRIPAGEAISKTSLLSIPAGKTAFGLVETISVEKGQDVTVTIQATVDGKATLRGAPVAVYQSPQPFPFTAPVVLPQKTDWRLRAVSTNPGTSVSTFIDFWLVDNSKLVTPPTDVRNLR